MFGFFIWILDTLMCSYCQNSIIMCTSLYVCHYFHKIYPNKEKGSSDPKPRLFPCRALPYLKPSISSDRRGDMRVST